MNYDKNSCVRRSTKTSKNKIWNGWVQTITFIIVCYKAKSTQLNGLECKTIGTGVIENLHLQEFGIQTTLLSGLITNSSMKSLKFATKLESAVIKCTS